MLVLHLKRWEVISTNQFQLRKKDVAVTFQTVLHLKDKDNKTLHYYLRAVLEHRGGAGGGHYTAFVRAADDHWYYCNDNTSPQPVAPSKVLAAQAYMLFYDSGSH